MTRAFVSPIAITHHDPGNARRRARYCSRRLAGPDNLKGQSNPTRGARLLHPALREAHGCRAACRFKLRSRPQGLGNMAVPSKPGRNDACPCGSGRKFKQCCGAAQRAGVSPQNLRQARAASLPIGPQLQVARQLQQAGRLTEAAGTLERISRARPDDPTVLQELGTVYLQARVASAAIAYFRRTIALDSRRAAAHRGLAMALHQQGAVNEAILAYQRAIELNPRDAESLSRLGNLLHGLDRRSEAVAYFRRSAAAAPNTTLGRLARAKALLADGHSAEGEKQLFRAIALDGKNAEANRLLGTVLAQAGRFDDAVRRLERSLDLDPSQAAAWHDLVHCRKLSEADRPWIQRMLERLERGDLTDPQRMRLHFALGKSFDDLGDYPDAMRHFDAANEIKRRLVPYDPTALTRMVDSLIDTFTPDFMVRNSSAGFDAEIPLLILGMPRSGTTLVEQVVSNHPAVAAGGELGFWSARGPAVIEALLGGDPEPARVAAKGYLQALRAISAEASLITDKTPYNFFWLGLLKLLFPRARLIHCRRDPVDTCLSIYTTHFAVPADFSSHRGNLAAYYTQYSRLMAHWREILPREAFVDVDYEELVATPEPAIRRLLDYCGLEWSDACLTPETNPREVKTASVWQARQAIYRSSAHRARHYDPWLGELRTLVVST
jgi:tetratricopeptide (TPR) repeat protein